MGMLRISEAPEVSGARVPHTVNVARCAPLPRVGFTKWRFSEARGGRTGLVVGAEVWRSLPPGSLMTEWVALLAWWVHVDRR